MRKMRDILGPSMLRFIKSVRLQRGGGWRAVRVGVVVMVVVVWAWVYLVSPSTHTPPSLIHAQWSSGSPNLQVVAPIREGGGGGGGGERDKLEAVESWKRTNIKAENRILPIAVRDEEERIEKRKKRGGGGGGGVGGVRILIEEKEAGKKKKEVELEEGVKNKNVNKKRKVEEEEEEEEQEHETNPRYNNRIRGSKIGLGKKFRENQILPNKRRLILPGDTKLLEEDEDEEEEEEEEAQQEEEEEEEGKWKGRNKEEFDNHAMEEEDDVVDIGDKEEEEMKEEDDFVEEDVGGEVIKRKRQRRDKPRKKKTENNNNNNNNNNKNEDKRKVLDPQNNNDPPQKNDLKENGKPGQRSKKEDDPADPLHEFRDLDLVAVEEEMRQRRSKVKQVCARNGLGPHAPPGARKKVKYPPTPSYETFYIDRGDRLAWCPVYKAASTSWLYGFLGLAGISESYVKNTKEQVSSVARRVWPALSYDEAKKAVSTCVKAVVVRHPFERLVSAFRDKLEKVAGGEAHGTEHFYKKYGSKIVEKYRNKNEMLGNKGGGGREKAGKHGNIGNRKWRDEELGRNIDAGERDAGKHGSIDDRKRKDAELAPDIDVRGGLSYGMERYKALREDWGNNGGSRGNGGVESHVGEKLDPQPPPQRYSNALDEDANPINHNQPGTQPPPVRYRHVLEDNPLQPKQPGIRYQDDFEPVPPLLQDAGNSPNQGKEPTFREFVKYLIETDLTLYADDHWMPYHLSCTPCLVDFDVIAKFETLDRDQAFLLRKTNLEGKLNFTWRHLTKGSRTKDVMKRYFADVSKKDLLSLFKKYRLDFEMFDYSVDEYLSYVKPD